MSKMILKYPGAKNRIADWIIKYIPKHKLYCEPFFGSGAVFFNKKPSYLEIINDLDDEVVNFFKVLRDDGDKLANLISLTPYSREEYKRAYILEDISDIERARRFAVKCWQGFGCGNRYKNGYRRGIKDTSPNPASSWHRLPENLIFAMERLKNAQIEKKDAIELIGDIHGEDAFIYIDPPYLPDTRKKYLYNHEMDEEGHIRLLEAIKNKDCKVMISGYDNELYNEYLKDWNKAVKGTTAEMGIKRTEVIWFNYSLEAQISFLEK